MQDIDFDYQRIHVHQAKGKKDRYVPLPNLLVDDIRQQITEVQRLHARDLAAGYGEAILPDALSRKYPGAGKELKWQFLFSSVRLAVDPYGGAIRRHHLHESSLQKAVKRAASACHLEKRVGCHSLRHYSVYRVMPNRQEHFVMPKTVPAGKIVNVESLIQHNLIYGIMT